MQEARLLLRSFVRQVRRSGYRCLSRRNGWIEVLLARGTEHWTGAGVDRASALECVLHQMFPSAAARAALLASDLERTVRAPPRAEPAGRLASAGAIEEAPRSAPELALQAADDVRPAVAAEPAQSEPHAGIPGCEPPPAVADPQTALASAVAPPTSAASVSHAPASRWELEEELQELEDTVDDLLEDQLLYSSRLQRLHLLAWVARARDLEERAGGRGSTHRRVSQLASKLGQLSKLGWPGAVYALSRSARPGDGTLDLDGGSAPRSWAEVADQAEQALSREEARAARAGLDEFGWADGSALSLAVPDPADRMRALRARLEHWFGPLASVDDVRTGGARALGIARDSVQRNLEEILDEAPGHARQLRWMRRDPPPGWGEAFGRMRCLASLLERRHQNALQRLLDEAYVPASTWAAECGYDPARKARKKQRAGLLGGLRELPSGDAGRLAAWLRAAFELGDELSTPRLAGHLRSRAADVLALDGAQVQGRSERRRLARLQEALRAAPTAEEGAESEALEVPSRGAEPEVLVNAVPEAIRARTRDKRVLFVGNRNDPELDQELVRAFELSDLRRVVVAANRTESAAESIKAGSFDIVLAATGFLPHKADSVLRAACQKRDVAYVRVDKGRVAACSRHLARQFGFRPS